jgi:hypothetical protein
MFVKSGRHSTGLNNHRGYLALGTFDGLAAGRPCPFPNEGSHRFLGRGREGLTVALWTHDETNETVRPFGEVSRVTRYG